MAQGSSPWRLCELRDVEGRARARRVEPEGRKLSDKTARTELGLTRAEIDAAIDAGQFQFQYRVGVIHGNPWLRLLRREVEELMTSTYDDRDHRQRRGRAELARSTAS